MLLAKKAKLKTKYITVKVGGAELQKVCSDKILGLIIDETLNWQDHINMVCDKISSKLGVLYRQRHLLRKEAKLLYYNSYILPHMDYCVTIWGNANKSQIQRIYRLQKRAARIILNAHYLRPTLILFKQLNWITFYDRILYQKAALVHKIVNNQTPNYINNLFSFVRDVTTRAQRSANHNKLYVPKPKSSYLSQSLMYSGAKLYNSLNPELRNAPSNSSFQSLMMNFLKCKYYRQ